MDSHEEQSHEEEFNDLNELDMLEDEEQDNDMQQLLASMLTSMDGIKQDGCNNNMQGEGNNNMQDGGNNIKQLLSSMLTSMDDTKEEMGSNNNMQQLLSSMLTSMQVPKEEMGCNINDLFSKLLGNMKNTEETLDDDYILSGEGDGCEGCEEGGEEGCEGCEEGGESGEGCEEGDGGEVLTENDFKEMITGFNEVNMMNNFKVMFEMLSKKIPQPKEDVSNTNMEDVD